MCVRMRVGTPTRMSSCVLRGHVHPTLDGKDKLLVEINQMVSFDFAPKAYVQQERPRYRSQRIASDT